ncbi:MAG TPA: prepilin-type N-terminal cleavage/methylation domain-containing protein [Candidatus Paceibacterota bacterium]|nr:prepilin-type N-terminal cleavage/methylation domain-containing protein [Candidatus Paceibacterota bacterium]
MIYRATQHKSVIHGFTLVETLVAITVLLLVIIGPITVAQKGIRAAYYANEQVTAVFLAQEAVEAIRELRDDAALAAYDNPGGGDTWNWIGALPPDCTDGTGCAFDITSHAFESCALDNNCELKVTAAGAYNYEAGGTDSGYVRRVYVTAAAPDAIDVTVSVTWTSTTFGGGTPRTITLETWIYDHYARYES